MPDKLYFLCDGSAVKYADLHKHPRLHIIGDMRRLVDDGHRVMSLARWVASVPTDTVPPIDPEIDSYLIGDVRRIRCLHVDENRIFDCDRVSRWDIDKAAIFALLARMGLEYPREEVENGREKVP